MRLSALCALMTFCAGVGSAPINFAAANQRRKDKKDCFIVTLHDTVAPGNHRSMFSNVKGTGGQMFSHAIKGFFRCDMNQTELKQIAKDPNVQSISEDIVATISTTTQSNPSWGLDRVDQRNLPLSKSYSYDDNGQGQGVYVFVVDTGVRATHNDFGWRVMGGYDAITPSTNANDCNGHGTHVAGTVAGNTYGIAKRASIVPVRVLGCDGSGSLTSVLSGLDWVMQQYQYRRPAVISMSLGFGGVSSTVDQAIANAVNSGITVVVAAGNSNADACYYSPGRVPSAITVGSTDSGDSRSYFSNYGSCVDIFAPGSDITSAYFSNDWSTATLSGTSMATPHVSGAAAVFLGKNPSATPYQVAAALSAAATVNKISNVGYGSPNKLLFVSACPSIAGYNMAENSDHVYDDITKVTGSIATIAAACSSNTFCLSFNDWGWIKRVAAPVTVNHGICFYSKVCDAASCNAVMNDWIVNRYWAFYNSAADFWQCRGCPVRGFRAPYSVYKGETDQWTSLPSRMDAYYSARILTGASLVSAPSTNASQPPSGGEVLAASSVCFGTQHNTSMFSVPYTGVVSAVRLVHKSGGFQCDNRNNNTLKHWGCNSLLTVVSTAEKDKKDRSIVWPAAGTANFSGFAASGDMGYTLAPYNSDSPQIIFNGPDVKLTSNNTLALTIVPKANGNDGNKNRVVCADVYVTYEANSIINRRELEVEDAKQTSPMESADASFTGYNAVATLTVVGVAFGVAAVVVLAVAAMRAKQATPSSSDPEPLEDEEVH